MMRSLLPLIAFLTIAAIAFAFPDTGRRREALRVLAERAAAGDARALYDLATLHDKGYDSIQVDSARSTALYRMSAERGYARAQNYLGFRYFNGDFVRKDVDSALYWIRRAADSGDLSAANNLGYLYMAGEGVARDYVKAAGWLSKAASGGVPAAQSQLGDLYRDGKGVAQDTLRAMSLYRGASESGIADADLKLMIMMKKSWSALSPDSALTLGRELYLTGCPVSGVMLLECSALKNNAWASALLGDAYSKGKGVAYDNLLAKEHYLRAARLGNGAAQFIVAELLDIFPDTYGDTVPAAEYWYGRAAASGIRDAVSAEMSLFGVARGEH